jgi:hypothetical protein
MGLSETAPTMSIGIQAMNTGVIGRARSLMQKSPNKLLFAPSPSTDSRKNHSGTPDGDDNDPNNDDVASVLKQPFVTVLMQSVKQIRTVNQEFYNSLTQRLANNTYSLNVNVGDIFERFAGVMPVYSTYASNHPFVLEELTTARMEDEGWDSRWSSGARAHSKALDALITACEADPRCEGKDLKVFLNIPLERVEIYRSALSALLMCTPRNHPDWNRMRLALGKIVESTKHMTRAIRRRENLERLREIDRIVDGWPSDFQLIDNRRWLVREGCLIERQTFAKRETHKSRYFWLFSDCIVMATKVTRVKTLTRLKSWGSSEDSQAPFQKYRFKRLINIGDMTICDLPHGVQSLNSGLVLGDPYYAFCIASVSSSSFVALVPNSPTDCSAKIGPAPVELARVGPPPAYGIATPSDSRGRPPVVYDKASVKNAWITDILLCIELFQRKAVFDDDEGIGMQQIKEKTEEPAKPSAAAKKEMTVEVVPQFEGILLNEPLPSPSPFTVENPIFSPVKAIRRTSSSQWRQNLSEDFTDIDDRPSRVIETEEF